MARTAADRGGQADGGEHREVDEQQRREDRRAVHVFRTATFKKVPHAAALLGELMAARRP